MASEEKINAMRVLDAAGIDYKHYTFDIVQ